MRIAAGVVDLPDERAGWRGDVNTALHPGAIGFHSPIPEAGKRGHRLIHHGDVVRRLAPLRVDVPVVEARGDLKAAVATLPWSLSRWRSQRFLFWN